MTYTVHQLAALARVSVRTLHYYDAVGILKPSRIRNNGYREYGESELLRLQQIMFFRELDLSLDEIKLIMDAPHFAVVDALREHKKFLKAKSRRLEELLRTIDRTIEKITKDTIMNDDELYQGFSKDEAREYQQEAKERWGNTEAYKQSTERVKKMGPAGIKKVTEANEALLREIVAAMHHGPKSKEVQILIGRHYAGLRAFYEPTHEMYRGLGEMYVRDERFGSYFKRFHPDLPEFMCDAMVYYCDKEEGR